MPVLHPWLSWLRCSSWLCWQLSQKNHNVWGKWPECPNCKRAEINLCQLLTNWQLQQQRQATHKNGLPKLARQKTIGQLKVRQKRQHQQQKQQQLRRRRDTKHSHWLIFCNWKTANVVNFVRRFSWYTNNGVYQTDMHVCHGLWKHLLSIMW